MNAARPSLVERAALADALRRARGAVVTSVTDELLARRPEWLARSGERARPRMLEDAGFHVDFLAGAVEAGSAAAFEEYARWTARTLSARGIEPTSLAEDLEQVGAALSPSLDAAGRELVSSYVAAGARAALAPAPPPACAEGLSSTREVLLQALLLGQRKPATTVLLEALAGGASALDLYISVLQPALYEVGRLWETNRITVAQEHMATAIVGYLLGVLYDRQVRTAPARGRVVITGVAGEHHSVGAHIVADALEADGWDVRFLGTNVPKQGVVDVVREHGASVLGVSATMLFNLPRVRELWDAVQAQSGTRPRLLLGGGAFRHAPDLHRELGADGVALDVAGALAAFRALPAG